jgi:uncharacterized protein YoxC
MDVIQMWWLSLAIFAVVIVVVAVLLGLIVAAARSIDGHAEKIWIVGKQIAGNTVSIWMLDQATEQLRSIEKCAESINEKTEAVDHKLRLIAVTGRKG